MFDFQKLEVYQKAKKLNQSITRLLEGLPNDRVTSNQLRRASLSIMLNIAEGSGRFTNPDKKNFYVIARGSAFECVAILDYLHDGDVIKKEVYERLYSELEEISKMGSVN